MAPDLNSLGGMGLRLFLPYLRPMSFAWVILLGLSQAYALDTCRSLFSFQYMTLFERLQAEYLDSNNLLRLDISNKVARRGVKLLIQTYFDQNDVRYELVAKDEISSLNERGSVFIISAEGSHPLNQQARTIRTSYGAYLLIDPQTIVESRTVLASVTQVIDRGRRKISVMHLGTALALKSEGLSRDPVLLHEKTHLHGRNELRAGQVNSLAGDLSRVSAESHASIHRMHSAYERYLSFDEVLTYYRELRQRILTLSITLDKQGWSSEARAQYRELIAVRDQIQAIIDQVNHFSTVFTKELDTIEMRLLREDRNDVAWGRIKLDGNEHEFKLPLQRFSFFTRFQPVKSRAQKRVEALSATVATARSQVDEASLALRQLYPGGQPSGARQALKNAIKALPILHP